MTTSPQSQITQSRSALLAKQLRAAAQFASQPAPPGNSGNIGIPRLAGTIPMNPMFAKPPLPTPPTAQLMMPGAIGGTGLPVKEQEFPIPAVASDLRNPDEAVNAHQLGRFEFITKLVAGGAIALLGSMAARRPGMALSELLGFGGFYGAMAASPHAVHALVKQKTGLDLDHAYLSSQGDARGLFADPQYLPLQLMPQDELDRIAQKLSIPSHLSNRRRVVEDRIRSVVAQAQTWWMLMVGPVVPIVGSLAGRAVEQPLLRGLNRLNQQWISLQIQSRQSSPAQARRLTRLIRTINGESPASELSQWWRQLQQETVKTLKLDRTTARADKLTQPYGPEHRVVGLAGRGKHTQFMDGIVNALYDLSPNTSHGASRSDGPALIARLEARLNKHYGTQLQSMAKRANQWIDQYASAAQKPYLQQALNTQLAAAQAQLNHWQTLLAGLKNGGKHEPSPAWIRTMIQNTTPTNLIRLLEAGDLSQARQLIDNTAKPLASDAAQPIYQALKAQRGGQGKLLESLVGSSLGDQIKVGVREALNNRRFLKYLVGGVGGAVAVMSGIFYALVLGQPAKRRGDYFRSPDDILKKYNVSNQFEQLQQTLALQKAQRATLPPRNTQFDKPGELKQMFRNNQSVIYGVNLRSFGAKDTNGDGQIDPRENEQGTFLSSIARLDELKALGVNTLHLLPINPPGVIKMAGNAGSVYAPADLHTLNPQLADKNSPLSIIEQARLFVDEAHKRGIKVMIDVPSCAAYDLALTRPELIAVDENGYTLTPGTWVDIVMFNNDDKLRQYYEGFFDLMANDLGVDGFRVDVARARPNWFWQHFLQKYPQHAWLAESYVEEDASPLANIPRDVPEQFLKLGFDGIYGQNHIFHKMPSGQAYTNYLSDVEAMFKRANTALGKGATPQGKSVIGSFLTHDDEETLMDHGGVPYSQLCIALMAFQPYTNPYLIDGMQTGYPHRIEIFNYSKPHVGQNPELATFMSQVFATRQKYADVLANGNYAQLLVDRSHDPNHMVFAYQLKYGDKKLLVVGNKDPNARVEATIQTLIPSGKPLTNVLPEYGRPSTVHAVPQGLHVNLGPARVMVFEV